MDKLPPDVVRTAILAFGAGTLFWGLLMAVWLTR